MTIPLNFGSDPDSRSGFRIKNIIFLKSLSTHSLFLRSPYVDQERSESLCGDTHNGKCWHQHSIVWRTTMEGADVSMPLFDAQQWKVRTSACHCLTHNNGNVNHSPHRNVNHSPHRVCFYVLHMWIRIEVSLCVESVLERSLNHSSHRVCFYVLHVWIRNEVSLCVESVLKY